MRESNSSDEKLDKDSDSQPIPKLYINGFGVGISYSDIYIMAQTAGEPTAFIMLSFTTAKTLAQELGKVVAEFEEKTNQDLLTMADIQKALDTDAEK
jgi:hypothetical protein